MHGREVCIYDFDFPPCHSGPLSGIIAVYDDYYSSCLASEAGGSDDWLSQDKLSFTPPLPVVPVGANKHKNVISSDC